MTTRSLRTLFACLALAAFGLVGCAPDGAALCREAQERGCTIISGDCDQVVSAIATVTNRAGCPDADDAYISCSAQSDVCTTEARCSAEENTLAQCATAYCVANPGDVECGIAASAF